MASAKFFCSFSHHITTDIYYRYRYILEANNGSLTIWNNGNYSNSTYTGSLLKKHNIFIFANDIDGTAGQYSHMKLYFFRMYDNGNIVRNFVPCINESGQYGLYDYITQQFYPNKGSGSFTGT